MNGSLPQPGGGGGGAAVLFPRPEGGVRCPRRAAQRLVWRGWTLARLLPLPRRLLQILSRVFVAGRILFANADRIDYRYMMV